MTVSELLSKTTSRELAEWMAFYQVEPWGTEVDLYGAAMIDATLHNIYGKKGTKPVSANDRMPKFGSARRYQQTTQEQLHQVEMLNKIFGGEDLRSGDDSEPIS
jgi:hypothetical protein